MIQSSLNKIYGVFGSLNFIAFQVHLATIETGTSLATGLIDGIEAAVAGAIQYEAGGIARKKI